MALIKLNRARCVGGHSFVSGETLECSDKDARFLIDRGHAVEVIACPPVRRKPKTKGAVTDAA
jgi:hypothetical protein